MSEGKIEITMGFDKYDATILATRAFVPTGRRNSKGKEERIPVWIRRILLVWRASGLEVKFPMLVRYPKADSNPFSPALNSQLGNPIVSFGDSRLKQSPTYTIREFRKVLAPMIGEEGADRVINTALGVTGVPCQ